MSEAGARTGSARDAGIACRGVTKRYRDGLNQIVALHEFSEEFEVSSSP